MGIDLHLHTGTFAKRPTWNDVLRRQLVEVRVLQLGIVAFRSDALFQSLKALLQCCNDLLVDLCLPPHDSRIGF